MSGTLFIVSAPSGAGKTTLVRMLLEQDSGVHLSVSYTTRAPRTGEIDGVSYHFTSADAFTAMRTRDEFLEWAEVHGNFYGTSKTWIAAQMAAGRDVLLEIDWQGAAQVRQQFPEAVSIFVLPPSLAELERRLVGRATDDAETVRRRLAAAAEELRQVDDFGYVIINDELPRALADLLAVVRAARLTPGRQRLRHPDLFSSLR